MTKSNEKKYFLEVLTDSTNSRTDHYITLGEKGYVVMIVSPTYRKLITPNGWIKTPHEGLEKVEIDKDNKHVLAYFKGKVQPLFIEIPNDVNPSHHILTDEHIELTMQQMKDFGLSFDDFWAEYYHGTNTVYSYHTRRKNYIVSLIDVIAASFYEIEELRPEEMKTRLKECASLHTFREQGFKL